jgi:hypothetical protein
LSPPRTSGRRLEEANGIGAICRARKVVAALGGRFSLEFGIDVDSGPQEVERWAFAATLLGNRISTEVAMRTYRVLERAGVNTIVDAGVRSREELVILLDEGGHGHYDERTAGELQALADVVTDRYGGWLSVAGGQLTDPDELEQALGGLPGWGPMTARAFLRELRGLWSGADPTLDERAAASARHVHLPAALDALRALAAAAHLDFRDLEAGLLRLALCHDFAACSGGEECPFAVFERDHFVHF